jgi:NAD(P)-dependent dehydrogenase (short-subunit alcohol dehydrogenase family)
MAAMPPRHSILVVVFGAVQDLQKKVVVITGAASGIGQAMANAFANEGSRLVIADIETEPLRIAEKQLRESGAEVLAVRTDVADSRSIEALAQATLEAFGAVHIVCNNAGVGHSLRPVWDFSIQYWEWLLGVIFGASSTASELLSQSF